MGHACCKNHPRIGSAVKVLSVTARFRPYLTELEVVSVSMNLLGLINARQY
jgi:hypothetical protein